MIVKTLAISHVAFLSIMNDVYSARFTPPVTIFELVTALLPIFEFVAALAPISGSLPGPRSRQK